MISFLTMKFRVVTSSGIFGRTCAQKINDSGKNSFSFYMFKKCKPFKVDIFTKTVSENVVHDKCDAMMFGPNFECALSEDETEPKMQCIEDCGLTMYICDCNVYR